MNKNSQNPLIVILFGFFACIILGLFFYGRNIFNVHDTRFQIVILGLYGSVVYGFINFRKPRNIIYVAFILLFIGFVIRGKSISFLGLIMDTLLIISIITSIYFYKMFINSYSNIPKFIRSIILMMLFGITNILATVLLTLIYYPNAEIFTINLLIYSKMPALIGLSLGIGFDTYEIFKPKLKVV